MSAEIIEFSKCAEPAPAFAVLQFCGPDYQEGGFQDGAVCGACRPRARGTGTSHENSTWTDDELAFVRIDVGLSWDTIKFEVRRDSPLHAKMLALLSGQ
jgi:hypothetical protein